MSEIFDDQVAINTGKPTLICQRGALTVFEVFDAELGCNVVVKRLDLRVEQGQDKFEQFQNEANLMMMVEHPNVLRCFGIWPGQDCCDIVLEPGIPLANLIRGGGLSRGEILTYFAQIAAGLAHLHAIGIVHRDIKCDNIIVVDGVAKIADFGEAALMTHPSHVLQELRGTVGFIPPEIIRGAGCQAASDIWSLGATLFEMVTRKMPFHGTEQAAYLFHVGMGKSTPLTSQEPYDNLINWCQSQSPDCRPTAPQLLAHLAATGLVG